MEKILADFLVFMLILIVAPLIGSLILSYGAIAIVPADVEAAITIAAVSTAIGWPAVIFGTIYTTMLRRRK